MLSYTDLKSGVVFIYEGQPWVVLSSQSLKMQQRRPVMQTKIRNLLNGKIAEHNFQQSDTFEEADIRKKNVKYLYGHRDEFWFAEVDDASQRFQLTSDVLGDSAKFLKQNTIVEAMLFNDEIINIQLPVKLDLKVKEAPPAIKGNTAQGGVKLITLETGASINAPLFINEGDTVRINTQTGQYTERVSKK